MTVILDLDDTLVETAGYKRVLFRALEPYGVPAVVVAESYRRLRRRHENSIEGLYEYLPKKFRPPYPLYMRAVARTLTHYYPLHIYSDVYWFLQQCRGHRRVLYTYGDTRVQQIKIRALGFRTLFHRVHITEDRNKIRSLTPLLQHGGAIAVVDNDSQFITDIRRRFPAVHSFCIRRGHIAHDQASYPDLRSIYHALKKEHLL